MRRVRHVEPPTRQRFDRRPVESVPRQIQQADRHAPIDRGGAVEIRRQPQSIFPRAREDRQLQRRVPSREQGLDELMRVLADAAAFAQRRAIVNHDAHLGVAQAFRPAVEYLIVK